jgi:hypothetical protein
VSEEGGHHAEGYERTIFSSAPVRMREMAEVNCSERGGENVGGEARRTA